MKCEILGAQFELYQIRSRLPDNGMWTIRAIANGKVIAIHKQDFNRKSEAEAVLQRIEQEMRDRYANASKPIDPRKTQMKQSVAAEKAKFLCEFANGQCSIFHGEEALLEDLSQRFPANWPTITKIEGDTAIKITASVVLS